MFCLLWNNNVISYLVQHSLLCSRTDIRTLLKTKWATRLLDRLVHCWSLRLLFCCEWNVPCNVRQSCSEEHPESSGNNTTARCALNTTAINTTCTYISWDTVAIQYLPGCRRFIRERELWNVRYGGEFCAESRTCVSCWDMEWNNDSCDKVEYIVLDNRDLQLF